MRILSQPTVLLELSERLSSPDVDQGRTRVMFGRASNGVVLACPKGILLSSPCKNVAGDGIAVTTLIAG
jgi:hypothetical protein